MEKKPKSLLGLANVLILVPALHQMLVEAYRKGAEQAAAHANGYNGSSTHHARLGDCILSKMNLTARVPRKNRYQVKADDEWLQGFAHALVEIDRVWRQPKHLRTVMGGAGVTLAQLKKAGVSEIDLHVLRRRK